MLAGWSAIAVAVLTVTGLVTLLAYFGTGSTTFGTLNELNNILMAAATVPVAVALHSGAARVSTRLAGAALAADFVGVGLVVVASALVVTRLVAFETALPVLTAGNLLIGGWLLLTAVLLLGESIVPASLGWLGIAGGAGLILAAGIFPMLGHEHAASSAAGLVALIGLVGFFAWTGVLLLRDGEQPDPTTANMEQPAVPPSSHPAGS